MLIQILRYCGPVAVPVIVNSGTAEGADHKMSTRSTGYSIGFLQFNFPSWRFSVRLIQLILNLISTCKVYLNLIYYAIYQHIK